MKFWNEIVEFLSFFFGGEVLRKLFSGLTKKATEVAGEKAHEALKTHFGGFGINDEMLALDGAARVAVLDHKVKPEEIVKIANVIKSYERLEQRTKIIRIFGGDEIEVTESVTKKRGDGKDAKEKTTTEKTTKNVRGGALIAMLAPLSEEQIKSVLEGFGTTIAPSDVVREMAKTLRDLATETNGQFHLTDKATAIVNSIDDWFGQEVGGQRIHNLRDVMAKKKANMPGKYNIFIFWR